MPKTAEKKTRKSPSVERQLALALIAILEEAANLNGNDDRQVSVRQACGAAREVLKGNGYADLESIPARVKRIDTAIQEALEAEDYDKIVILGAAMKRAKAGLPPLDAEKRPRTKKTSTKKPDKAAPKSETVPVKCSYSVCGYEGEGVVGEKCPDCETPLSAA